MKFLWSLGFPFEFQLKFKKKPISVFLLLFIFYLEFNFFLNFLFWVDWGNYWLVFDVIETLLLLQAILRKKRQQFWIATKTIIVVWVRPQLWGLILCRCRGPKKFRLRKIVYWIKLWMICTRKGQFHSIQSLVNYEKELYFFFFFCHIGN